MKIVVVGLGGVGKSALVVQYVNNNFVEVYDPTIEANYRKQVTVRGESVLLDILDTAGQDEYSVLREQYMRQGDAFLLLYSITQPQSFKHIGPLHAQCLRYAPKPPVFALVATKADLEQTRAISEREGRRLAQNLGCPFIETSSKLNVNVEQAFLLVVDQVLARSPGARKKRSCSIL